MSTPTEPRRRPDTAALVAGIIGIAALAVWIASWLVPSPHDEPAPPPVVTPAAPVKPKPEATESIAPPPKSAEQKSEPPPKPRVSASPPDAPPKPAAKAAAPKAPAADAVPEGLSGRYVGTYSSASETVGLTLEISGAANGAVSGTATLGGQACRGRYPMEGSYRGNKLSMRAPRNGGPAGDCPLNFVLALENGRLAGTTAGGDRIHLRK